MKKTYIEPKTVCVSVRCKQLLQSVSGDGLHMSISNSNASGAAESRGSDWDDEEDDY